MSVSLPFELPAGLSYDGVMFGGFHQFTERDEARPSLGASFYLKTENLSLENLVARREEKAREFAQ